MNPSNLKYCPCTLAEGFNTYSPSALRNMFFGKKVSHILDFDPPDVSEEVAEKFRQNSKTISISVPVPCVGWDILSVPPI